MTRDITTIAIGIILIITTNLQGQNHNLTGRIIDSNTKQPLPYATVIIHSIQKGTMANKNGEYAFNIPSEIVKTDTVEFSFLGYEKLNIPIKDVKDLKQTTGLKPKVAKIGEITVKPQKYKSKTLGCKKNKPHSGQYGNYFGGYLGNFIANEKHQEGWFKNVSFYIYEDGFPTAPFRIRIFDVDNEGKPSDDLLLENIVVHANSPGWFTYDLSKYNIEFPAKGAFVMMEIVNSGDDFYFEKETTRNGKTSTRKYYGLVLGFLYKQTEMITWGKGIANQWIPYDRNYKGFMNAMINAEVYFPK